MKEDTRTKTTNTGRAYQDDNLRAQENARRGKDNPYLYRLKDLDDYKVASDDPDVRGWDVVSGDNEKIGKVDELIVDTKRMKVRYLVVDVKDEVELEGKDKHMLVPVGTARLHEKNNDVIVSNITRESVRNYPVYPGDNISREYENSIRRWYEAGATTPAASMPAASASESITEHETIRDAHTGKTYERRQEDRPAASPTTRVDSNSRNRVDVVTGTSGEVEKNEKAYGKGQMSDLPQEDRMKDRSQASSNSIRGDRSGVDARPDRKTPLGSFNHTQPSDIRERIGTTGISSSRTSNLPNKDLEQGPTGGTSKAEGATKASNIPEEERVRIHDTDPNVAPPKSSGEADFNETSDLNRSTSLGNDMKRGSNMGNQEKRAQNPGIQDRSRMSSPQNTERTTTPGGARHPDKYPEETRPVQEKDLRHSSEELPDDRYDPETDEFYTHDHFDEERFYGNRRRREE